MLSQKYEALRLKARKSYINHTKNIRRKKISNPDFTIISNNCWAGFVYQSYGLPYETPTIGLFFMADDYIKFISDLKKWTSASLSFIDPESSSSKMFFQNDPRFGSYPIGTLEGEIEIHFLHYHSPEEAAEKWRRRCERINWDRLLVKFNDQNGCTEEHIKKFEELPLKNKLCFSVNSYPQYKSVITIRAPKSHSFIRASYEPFGHSKYLNLDQIIDQL